MERGIVVHLGINPRGNRYGFIRTESGERLYFNQFGGMVVVVMGEHGLRPARTWDEGLHGLPIKFPMPAMEDEIFFERKVSPDGSRPVAHDWFLIDAYVRSVHSSAHLVAVSA